MNQSTSRRSDEATYDYVVVGAGSAGAVVANRLATSAERPRVLLLEAGGTDISPFVQIPAGILWMPHHNYWEYGTEPDPTRRGRRDMWAAGKVLGGSSSVNAMLWVRGNRADYDRWAEMGASGWDFDSLLPLMRDIEDWTGPPSRWRGRGGPQTVSPLRVNHPMVSHWLAGTDEAGFTQLADVNGENQFGAGPGQLSQRNGLRNGTGRSYVAPARRHGNLTVRTHAQASRILFDGNRALGVEYLSRGRRRRAYCRREVIVSCGAIGSPALLQRSGVGDAELLGQLGVGVVADAPMIGRHLQEHPIFTLSYRVREKTLNQEFNPVGMLRGAAEFALHRRGPATAGLTHATAYGRIDPGSPWPDFQFMFSPMATMSNRPMDASEVKDKRQVSLPDDAAVNCHVCLLHPRSEGTVSITSTQLEDMPRIELDYYGDPRDLTNAISAARRAREVFQTTAMKPVVIEETDATRHLESDEDWADHIAGSTFNAAHWVGTIRMGAADDSTAALDPQLRVKGVQGVRVADASVMPTLTSGNTNAPSVLIGEKASRLILGERDRHLVG